MVTAETILQKNKKGETRPLLLLTFLQYPKQAYPTQKDALKRAQIIYNERGTKLYIYKCRSCGEYHLTHTHQIYDQFTLDEIFI